MMEILFFFSIVVNVSLVWYIIQLLKRYLAFQDELDEFADKIKEYEAHIDVINKIETYYGDETLANLLRHSKAVAKECERFKIYIGLEEDTEEEINDEE